MWSIGVILFALLSGTLPFNEKNEGATQELIKRGHFHFRTSPIWRNITSSAKNLIQSFLQVDPSKRLNCNNALHHDWFQIPDHILASKSLDDVLPELKKFQAKKRWKKAMLSVVALNRFKSFSRNASRDIPATPMEGVTTETLSGENPAQVYLCLSHSNDFQLEKFQPTLPPLPPDQEEEESDAAATALGNDRFLLFETEVLKKERNGYVTTFKGMNKETKETVAIKKILLSRLSSREIASYRNEVKILRTLSIQDHSHLKEFEGKSVTTLDTQIIQFYDSYIDEKENILYIVTELIDGSELFDRIYQKKYYHEKQARDLVKPLLIALHSMHSKGIIHR
jgi:serine/threonine protein kinase